MRNERGSRKPACYRERAARLKNAERLRSLELRLRKETGWRLPRLECDAAGYLDDGAGDVACFVRGEPGVGVGDLLRAPEPSHGHLLLHHLHDLVRHRPEDR